MKRVYCDGSLSKSTLADQLDAGFVLIDLIKGGYLKGDVAYFREGTPEEIERLRKLSPRTTETPE